MKEMVDIGLGRYQESRLIRADGPHTPIGRISLAAVSLQETGVSEWPLRYFDAYALMIVLAGRGTYRDRNSDPRPLGPGDAVLVIPGHGHWYGPPRGETWAEWFVIFEGSLFDLLRDRGVLSPVSPVLQLGAHTSLAARLTALLSRPARTGPASLTEILEFASLLGAAVETGGEVRHENHDPILVAQELLRGELGKRLPAQAVATAVGLPYETFRKRFTAQVGVAPKTFRDQARIQAARLLLRSTRMSNREIALVLGYADEFHFSRRFRSSTGHSPRSFRARERRENQ